MNKPKINSCRFGEIIIDNVTYKKDLIIKSDVVLPNWQREKGHAISLVDLKTVLCNPPQILVFGTGFYGRVEINKSIINSLEETGIQVIHQKTSTAWKTYNELSSDRYVIAALHLTC